MCQGGMGDPEKRMTPITAVSEIVHRPYVQSSTDEKGPLGGKDK